MTEDERLAALSLIARNPQIGVLIDGGGGLRKLRFGIGGRGKSGGVRIIYYFHDRMVPVFLLTVFAKNEKDDLSKRELVTLARACKALAQYYGC